MPQIVVHMRRGRSRAEKKAILDAIHEGVVEGFKTPAADRFLRVVEYDPEDFELPPHRSDKFLLVEMTVFPGRSLEAKRSLYQGTVRRLEALGVAGDDVMIILNEPPKENWGVRGGQPASEVDLGYRLDV